MQIEVGAIVSGKITGITDFGAFVEIEGGKTGMVHISEVSTGYVKDIREHLTVGQEVKVKVIGINEAGKISLSIRKVDDDGSQEKRPERRPQQDRPQRQDNRSRSQGNPHVWQGQKSSAPTGEKQSFEDMMASFKKQSEEKMSDLKRADSKRGSVGYSRRGKNN